LLIAALPAVLVLGIVAFVFTRAQHSLNRAGTAVAGEGRFPFEMRTLGRIENPGFEAIASPATYTSGAFFQGKLYVSGPSGLFVYGDSAAGVGVSLLKSYRVGLDLPAAPLGTLVVGRLRGASEPELMIATSGAGVLFFSGDVGEGKAGGGEVAGEFRQLLPKDQDARDITALLPLATGELLVGTRRRGLLIFHGETKDPAQASKDTLEVFHPKLANLAVTSLAADATGFWVGTQDRGVLHCHGGQIDSFDGASGSAANVAANSANAALPDAHVDAIAVDEGRVFVGTPMGVEEFDDGRPARTLAKDVFVHALYADRKAVTIGSMDEGIRQVSLETSRRRGAMSASFAMAEQDMAGPVEQFVSGENGREGNALYAVMRDGVRRQRGSGWAPLTADATGGDRAKMTGGATLTDGNISALAVGADGRLWVGYFDRGLDVLSSAGERAGNLLRTAHLEDDRIFCVNRMALDPRRKTMAVATANGLVLMDAQGKARQVMTQRDGLIADHVTDVAFRGGSMVLATPAGITFVDASGAESLYAFHGLVNNHVYALGVRSDSPDDEILAGTLGGVSDVVHESVRRNYTVSNSGLKHNWVTAIVPASGLDGGADWMAGTYGAGVMRIDKDGRFSAMDGVTRDMIVNPNAMLSTDKHILAGTLGQGMWVWSKATGRWRQITAGLPSENVTAFAEDSGEVYVGTENGLVRIAERLLD
jgi:hypothetical protein